MEGLEGMEGKGVVVIKKVGLGDVHVEDKYHFVIFIVHI